MLHGLRLPTRALQWIVGGLAAACAGTHGTASSGAARADSWSDGIPRGQPTVVTIENLNYDPPRALGLVSKDHAGVANDEAELRKSGFKRVEVDDMNALLDKMQSDEFVASSVALTRFEPVDRAHVIGRLVVIVGEETRAFTLPRGARAESIHRFNKLAEDVTSLFNATFDARLDKGNRSSTLFFDVQQRLIEHNRSVEKQRKSEKEP